MVNKIRRRGCGSSFGGTIVVISWTIMMMMMMMMIGRVSSFGTTTRTTTTTGSSRIHTNYGGSTSFSPSLSTRLSSLSSLHHHHRHRRGLLVSTTTTTKTKINNLVCLSLSNNDQDHNNNDDEKEEDASVSSSSGRSNGVDRVLGRLTSMFPFFVFGSAVLGLWKPNSLMWVNRGNWLTYMLASVMVGTGLTLERSDFILDKDRRSAVPFGVLCQFGIMPLAANYIGRKFLSSSSSLEAEALFLGLILVGCSPGGTASNLVSLIAGADVALSVILTACSTLLASVLTPLLVKTLVGSTIVVSGIQLCQATAQVVLLPVLLGMYMNAKAPQLSNKLSRFTPFASVLLVSLICGGVVAQNASSVLLTTTTNSSSNSFFFLGRIMASVLALHTTGFVMGYLLPRKLQNYSEQTSRTISIETGMQNSALAVVLARSINAPALAALPGALSATTHSCLGSLLSAYWRYRDNRPTKPTTTTTTTPFYTIPPPPKSTDPPPPDFSI